MIRLTRLNHGLFMLNPDLIEHLESTPDTVITLTNGHQFMVLESADEVLEAIVAFRRAAGVQCVLTRIPAVRAGRGEEERAGEGANTQGSGEEEMREQRRGDEA